MKVELYGPTIDTGVLAEVFKCIPEGTKHVVVQCPPRRAPDLRPCQRPGVIEYTASCDNATFIHVSEINGVFTVKVTK
jgi:hypothetical protein